MKSIDLAYMECDSCGWKGQIKDCGEQEHDDGQFDCPQCHSPVRDDFEREKLYFLKELIEFLAETTNVPGKLIVALDEVKKDHARTSRNN